ncbi:MAG: ATPase [Lachnospiraceae bacterium]|nr:ATPase [Lachnospiraceae bacterium]
MIMEKKLQQFLDICMEDARNRSSNIFHEYSSALKKDLEKHKTDARRQAAMQIHSEEEKIRRELNKELAIGQINSKRTISLRHDELKEKIFIEVKDLLEQFMETPQYLTLLNSYIEGAKAFAGDDEVIFYLDPADSEKVQQLSYQNQVPIKVSQYSFGGGLRAVIPSRNILIDHSFDTRLHEERQAFLFQVGGVSNG